MQGYELMTPLKSYAEKNFPMRVLITDIESLHNDLLNYLLQESKDVLLEILSKLEKKDKKVNKVIKELIRLKRLIKEQERQVRQERERRDNERIFYFLLGAMMMSCIIIFFSFYN